MPRLAPVDLAGLRFTDKSREIISNSLYTELS